MKSTMADHRDSHQDENGASPGTNADGNNDELERHIVKRFEIQDRLGKGAYGIVWKAFDRKEQRTVALKKIFDAFGNGQDAQRTFREVCFLTSFSVHPNIVKLTDIIRAENKNDLYLSFEYMPIDLHALIKSKNGLQDVHIRYIMAQLFRTLYFIHSANVIHRDLKPANILLTHPCEIRVADFGLARSLSDPDDNFQNGNLTNYVATRWYRSPEILLGSKRYTKGVDIWSLGTILAEMLRGRPLFTGENTIEQISFIRGALAEPTTQDLHYCDSSLVRSVFNYPPHRDFRRPLESYMRSCGAPIEAVDLIRRLLHWDPDKRIDLMKAMRHPYVNGYYDPHSVYISDIAVTPFISDDKHFEDPSIYREALYEILHVQEINKTPKSPKSIAPEDDDDVTLRSQSPVASVSSLDYEPLQTPVPESRNMKTNNKKLPEPTVQKKGEPPVTIVEPAGPPKQLPFGEAVKPGGEPVKHGRSATRENLAPGRRPLEKSNSRTRIIAPVEQPAVLYKTSTNGSSGNLQTQASVTNLTTLNGKAGNGAVVNGTKKAVKFEDDSKKVNAKDKPVQGEGDGSGMFAKRFSFDGRAIRDRLPYVKRSNSLARSPTPEPSRKFPTTSETRIEKKSLKDSWRDTLAKSTVPEFFKRTGSRKAFHSMPSTSNVSSTDLTVGGKSIGIKNGYTSTTSLKSTTITSGASIRPASNTNNYGTLKTGLLQNLKGYGRA